MGTWKFCIVLLIGWWRTFILSLCKAKSSASSGILFWGVEKPVSTWKPSSVANGGSEVHPNSCDGVEIWIFLNCFSADASPILTILGYIEDLGATGRPMVLRCCAEGVLSRPKLRKLMIMKLCCSAVDECFKRIGRGPE